MGEVLSKQCVMIIRFNNNPIQWRKIDVFGQNGNSKDRLVGQDGNQ